MGEKRYIVYKHTSPSGKSYIGLTSRLLEERSGHQGIQYKKQAYFYNAITKYGWDNFSHEILQSDLSREEATKLEQFYIDLYHSNDPRYGYNLTNGGEVNYELSAEVKRHIAEKTKKQWQQPEIRERMIVGLKKSHKGVYTERQRMANARRRGIPLSLETREKQKGHIPWNKGKKKPYSEETILKMKMAAFGRKPANKGTHLSEEQRKIISQKTKEGMSKPEIKRKIIESHKKQHKWIIYQYDLNHNLIAVHHGISNAVRSTGIPIHFFRDVLSLNVAQVKHDYLWKKDINNKGGSINA